MSYQILTLPGDGIGPEVTHVAEAVLRQAALKCGVSLEINTALIGGAAIDATGDPLPESTLEQAKSADSILLGAVGGPKWEGGEVRPEQGLLKIRQELDCYANLRPALVLPQLVDASSLKAELVSGLDCLIVRELTGGIYFGEPRAIERKNNELMAYNTMVYSESEIKRIAITAFEAARKRQKRLCSVDKANVLEVSQLWRQVVDATSQDYPDVELSHLYVDNAAMQLVRQPKQFDVILTSNLFGDILSDCAAMLTGSIGMLPSASLNQSGQGIYEPVHGSAPDIAGQDSANPLACVLSAAMLCRYSLGKNDMADLIEQAVSSVIEQGLRTIDIARADESPSSCSELGQAVINAI